MKSESSGGLMSEEDEKEYIKRAGGNHKQKQKTKA